MEEEGRRKESNFPQIALNPVVARQLLANSMKRKAAKPGKAARRTYEAEKKRRQRERIRNDPVLYEANKKAEKERSRKRREEKKIKSINDMTEREKRKQRRMWKVRNERRKKAAHNAQERTQNTPPASEEEDTPPEPVPAPLQCNGRKLHQEKIKRAKQYQEQKKRKEMEAEIDHYKKAYMKWKTRYYREKAKQTENIPSVAVTNSGLVNPSPNTKALSTMEKGKEEVHRQLVVGEILKDGLNKKSDVTQIKAAKDKVVDGMNADKISTYKMKTTMRSILGRSRIKKRLEMGQSEAKANDELLGEDSDSGKALKKEVRIFLEEDGNSFPTPGIKDTITRKKIKKQKRYLTDSLVALHKKFVDIKKTKISYSLFCKLKPFWIVKRTINQRDTCLCTKHEDIELLFRKLKFMKLLKHSKVSEVLLSLCCDKPISEMHTCFHRLCKDCQSKRLQFETNDEFPDKDSTSYHKWARLTEEKTKSGKTYTITKSDTVEVKCTVLELKQVFEEKLEPFMAHYYRAFHQTKFSKDLKASVDESEIIIIMDFSEKYQLKHSREIQSAHFGASNRELTLHTGAYYVRSGEDVCVTTFCSVSESPRQDAAAIWAHLAPVFEDIKKAHPHIKVVHMLSDGPTKQYRNKSNLFLFCHYMAKAVVEKASYNFSEAGHGKSVADGVGGTVKRTCDNYVAAGNDVATIEQLFVAVKGLKTKMYLIQAEEIEMVDKVLTGVELLTIPHTMKLHQITIQSPNYYSLHLRSLSCLQCRNESDCVHYTQPPGIFKENQPTTTPIEDEIPSSGSPSTMIQPCSTAMPSNDFVSQQQDAEEYEESFPDVLTCEIDDGDWVAVIFNDQWYPGQIIGVNDELVKIAFMVRNGRGTNFRWPLVKDEQVIHVSGILSQLKPPQKVSSRIFSFDQANEIDKLCERYITHIKNL